MDAPANGATLRGEGSEAGRETADGEPAAAEEPTTARVQNDAARGGEHRW